MMNDMAQSLYKDIGAKLKNWAVWIFLVEAVGAVITGLVLMVSDTDMILYGLLTMVSGPLVAWVSSWLLYAFGELVEKTIRNEQNTQEIVVLLKQQAQPAEDKGASVLEAFLSDRPETTGQTKRISQAHQVQDEIWICGDCGKRNMLNRDACWSCGSALNK